MIRLRIRHLALAGAIGLGACGENQLVVDNPNQADTKRVLQLPGDLENLVGSYYKRAMSGPYGTSINIWGMAAVQSFENFSTLLNSCMGARVAIPRGANDNTLGNGCQSEQGFLYNRESEVENVASSSIAQIEGGLSLGSVALDKRAIAFAQFERGFALGYLAMFYDSAAVITPAMVKADAGDAGTLMGYKEVMDSALTALQASLDATDASVAAGALPGASSAFPLPSTWIPSNTSFTAVEFKKLVRSYRARFRANVARTPLERGAVDWALVIADAQNGITADHDNITSTITGPTNSWVDAFYSYASWHQMTPFVIGMGDTLGTYDAWIKTPLATRGAGSPFFMATPDRRFPQGATRVLQQADFKLSDCSAAGLVCKRYFVNRPTDNQAAFAWGQSNYDHSRHYSWRTSGDAGQGANGKFPFFTLAELDLLQAEGLIRTNQGPAAAILINKTRVANNLPPVTGVITDIVRSGTNVAPGTVGGASCVPRVPVAAPVQGAGSPSTKCGDMFEALKWEKRMETAYTHMAAWFLDSRGWGDLPEGTGLHWAVPYQDLQVRLRRNYSAGGGLPGSSAPLGTYGW